jgi:hypothetical protein
VTDRELLEQVFVWQKARVGLDVFIVLLLFVVLYLKWVIYKITVAYLRRAEETLAITKEWSYLAHNQHKDAQRVMAKVEERTETSGKVIQAVEAVPDKVVDRITERAGESADSGRLKVVVVPPPQQG